MSATFTDVLAVGPFAENAYLLACGRTREAVLIDPGDEAGRILAMTRAHGVRVTSILATHGHLDHVGAVAPIAAALGVPFLMHAADRFLIDALAAQAQAFGLTPPSPPKVDGTLDDGDVITVGELSVRVLHTPGHSPGGVSLLTEDLLFSGDALFLGSIGRTDLPGGDLDTLIASIRERLFALGDGTRVLPGHGPETTIGFEREHNPFLI